MDSANGPHRNTTNSGSASVANNDDKEEEVILPPTQPTFYESPLFRWISVFLYLGGISGLGMVLSLYYLLFFDSRMPEIHLRFPVSIDGQPVHKVQQYS